MKIQFIITEKSAWAEIEQSDGTMKKWSEKLAPKEYAAMVSAGMMMQRATMMHCLKSNADHTNRKIKKLEQQLLKAEALCLEIINSK